MSDEVQLNPEIKGWSRRTAADGLWLNENTISPIKTHIGNLISITENLDAAVDNEIDARSAADQTLYNSISAVSSTVENLTGISADVTAISSTLNDKVDVSSKGIANGIAVLDADGKIPASSMPPAGDLEVSTDLAIDNDAIKVNTNGTANSANKAFVAGSGTYADGIGAAAFGIDTSANDDGSFVVGIGNYSNNSAQFIAGKWNEAPNVDTVFVVGIGTDDNNRRNGFVVTEDGDINVPDRLQTFTGGITLGIPTTADTTNSAGSCIDMYYGTRAQEDVCFSSDGVRNPIGIRFFGSHSGNAEGQDYNRGVSGGIMFSVTNTPYRYGVKQENTNRFGDGVQPAGWFGFSVWDQGDAPQVSSNAQSGCGILSDTISATTIIANSAFINNTNIEYVNVGFSGFTGVTPWQYGYNLEGIKYYFNMGYGNNKADQWTITIPKKKKAMVTPSFTIDRPANTDSVQCVFYVGLTTNDSVPQTGTNFTTADCSFLDNSWHRIVSRPDGTISGLAKDTYMPTLYYYNSTDNDITARVRIYKDSISPGWTVNSNNVNWMIFF